jgi:molybdopterin synthase sulfur carrier subunit
MTTIRIPPILRSAVGGEREIPATGATVGEVLEGLATDHPDTRVQLFGQSGGLNKFVNVYINDEDVRVLDGLETGVGADDVLLILPAMAGGCS